MRIAILGARGFLGQRLTHSLSAQGHHVIAVSRGASPAGLPTSVHYIQAPIDDTAVMKSVLAISDFAIHLAWDTTPGTSERQPLLEVSSNILSSARLLELLHDQSSCNLIFISSGGALYADLVAPRTESSPVAPRSYYGAAKAAVEQLIHAFHCQSRNTTLVVRPSNIYGPGQIAKRQFGVVPTLMRCARDGTLFSVWGDGSAVRDYLYIEDFEQFVSNLLGFSWPHGSFECFNVGSGLPLSMNALLHQVAAATGHRIQFEHKKPRLVDPRSIVLDSSKAGKMLGWEPRIAIGTGLRKTWEWMEEQACKLYSAAPSILCSGDAN